VLLEATKPATNGAEDIKHIIFECDRSKEVWRTLGIWSLLGVSYSTGDGGPVWFDSLGGDNTKGDQVWAMDIRLTGFILTGTDTT
jgi:hypothetical protein